MPNHTRLCQFPIARLRKFEDACIEVYLTRRKRYRECPTSRNLRRLKNVTARLHMVQIAILAVGGHHKNVEGLMGKPPARDYSAIKQMERRMRIERGETLVSQPTTRRTEKASQPRRASRDNQTRWV